MTLSEQNLKIIANQLLVYIAWGSLYICFSKCLEVIGPFLLSSIRMLLAGVLIYLFLLFAGRWRKVTRHDWLSSFWLGFFMVLIGSGCVIKGQEYVASGVAAMINGTTPITMLLAAWLFAGEDRPTAIQWLGLFGGFCSLVLLIYSRGGLNFGNSNLIGILWVYTATLGWVSGSLISKKTSLKIQLPELQTCALLFLAGGLESAIVGLCRGEASLCQWQNLNMEVILYFLWMVIVSSIIAYACYFWLLYRVSTAAAISYEYVVPIIGLFLGWAIGSEIVNSTTLLACALLITSVFFVLRHKHSAAVPKRVAQASKFK